MTMNVNCKDRDRIFEDGKPDEWVALDAHATSCTLCAEELRVWKSLSLAAQELREYSVSPALWPRIERALAEEAAKKTQHAGWRDWLAFLQNVSIGWQTTLAGALVFLLAISVAWIYLPLGRDSQEADRSLL